MNYRIREITIQDARPFVEQWHYSHNTNGISQRYCFGLFDGDIMIGVSIYAYIAMSKVWKKYREREEDVIELRRLCCIDDAPKNTESYFIARTIDWLKRNSTAKIIVSYADPMYGHKGIVYQASNFTYVGRTSKGRVIRDHTTNKLYHDKTIRTYYINVQGERKLKPYAQRLRDKLANGKAEYMNTDGKYIYVYPLNAKSKEWAQLNKQAQLV